MSDCGNVKKVFVPNDAPVVNKDPSLTFGASDVAIEKVRHFITKDGKDHVNYGLRVQVVKDGCSGNSYDISLSKIDDAKEKDRERSFDDLDRPITARNGLKQQTTQDMFESFEKTKRTGDREEELLDIPRFLRRQDPDLDF